MRKIFLSRSGSCWNFIDVLIYICLIFVSFFSYSKIKCVMLSPQSLANIDFIDKNMSWVPNLGLCPKIWPPLYPVLLNVLTKIGLPPASINFLFFNISLILMIMCFRSYIKAVHWVWPALLYSLSAYNYYNMRQYTPELLFICLSLIIFISLFVYARNPNYKNLLILSIFSALSCLTKYISLFWILPIVASNIVLVNLQNTKRIISHTVIFLVISLVPMAIWTGAVYTQTGYFTGMDRFGHRIFRKEMAHWHGINTAQNNLIFIVKTVFIDFFSHEKVATHRLVTSPYQLKILNYLGIGIILFIFLSSLKAIFVFLKIIKKSSGSVISYLRKEDLFPCFVIFELVFLYLFATVLVWSISNNDPIYSMFLYPSYPYLLISIYLCYSYIKINKFYLQALVFKFVFIFFIAINFYRIVNLCSSGVLK